MKITIEAEPKEVAELLQAIRGSEEQNITLDSSKIVKGLYQDQSNSLRRSGVSEDRE